MHLTSNQPSSLHLARKGDPHVLHAVALAVEKGSPSCLHPVLETHLCNALLS